MSTPDAPVSPFAPPSESSQAPAQATAQQPSGDASPYARRDLPADAPGGSPLPQPRHSRAAVAAFVVGLVSVVLCALPLVNLISVVGGLVAVVLGVVGLRTLRPGVPGKGFAIAGTVLGAVGLVVAVVMLLVIGAAVKSLDESGELGAILDEVQAVQEAGVGEQPAASTAEVPAEVADAPGQPHVGAPELVREDFSGLTCDVLADQAVAMSQSTAEAGSVLVDVRDAVPVEDHLVDYPVPAGAEESLVLSCRGTATWDDATESSVLTQLTIDSAAELYVDYAAE
ncbi:hypothetical protein [Cellulomonas aerilata]|uniref:DUF4190 domain-containing protein n=1 Tax=Cellulomonas aerilata TaxID=515326 RepID=A0A512D7C4_9CELL|nr:hypothetical protein [Cellulomonas aerilata]GEO32383.1 hypothetical protein CAE01nite_01080 [Cellulomonas aerilata]